MGRQEESKGAGLISMKEEFEAKTGGGVLDRLSAMASDVLLATVGEGTRQRAVIK